MSENDENFDPTSLSELLPLYYKRLFPFGSFYRWLNYGDVDSRNFSNREFSFTLQDNIYIRFQSFKNQFEMEEAVSKVNPHKIDIGAVFSFPPSSHRHLSTALAPIFRELVFDIDLTDYDDVRTCCQGTDVCIKCWKFMSLACKILDTALREDFGFKHLLWVFSGRRGIHCWVCDESARKLTAPERTVLVEFLQLIAKENISTNQVHFPDGDKLHSSVRRAASILHSQFFDVCIKEQGLLQKPESVEKLLALIPDDLLKTRVQDGLQNWETDEDKWQFIVSELSNKDDEGFQARPWLLEEIMIKLAYPRLDINVTKGLNHLLKSPFCIHPKTGKVCVPFNPRGSEKFNPTQVPTLTQLVREVNDYDDSLKQLLTENEITHSRVKDYKKTALNKGIQVFEEFVRELEDTWKKRGDRIPAMDPTMEF